MYRVSLKCFTILTILLITALQDLHSHFVDEEIEQRGQVHMVSKWMNKPSGSTSQDLNYHVIGIFLLIMSSNWLFLVYKKATNTFYICLVSSDISESYY